MMNEYIITEENVNKRLDVFLNEIYTNLSRSNIQKNIKNGFVKVNNKIEKSSYKLKLNNIVNFNDFYNEEIEIEPQDIDLDIKYEDAEIVVINKPKNMLTHPTLTEKKDTLVNGLLYVTTINIVQELFIGLIEIHQNCCLLQKQIKLMNF